MVPNSDMPPPNTTCTAFVLARCNWKLKTACSWWWAWRIKLSRASNVVYQPGKQSENSLHHCHCRKWLSELVDHLYLGLPTLNQFFCWLCKMSDQWGIPADICTYYCTIRSTPKKHFQPQDLRHIFCGGNKKETDASEKACSKKRPMQIWHFPYFKQSNTRSWSVLSEKLPWRNITKERTEKTLFFTDDEAKIGSRKNFIFQTLRAW